MPRNSSGTYTPTAGQPVVTNTVIDPTVFNNLVADLGTEITDSLDRSGKGAMLAALKVTDGTVAAPGLALNTEAGTGLYKIGAADLGVSVAGTKRLEIAASGVTVPNALTVTGGDVTLNGAGIQSFLKTGNALHIGSGDANEVDIVYNGAVVAAWDATRYYNGSRPITNVTDPTNAQDAATKHYVDAGQTNTAFTGKPTATATVGGDGSTTLATKGYVDGLSTGTDGTSSISWGTNWSTTGANDTRVFKIGPMLFLRLSATRSAGASTTVCTLPAGYRPIGNPQICIGARNNSTSLLFSITSGGVVTVDAIYANGDTAYLTVSLPTI